MQPLTACGRLDTCVCVQTNKSKNKTVADYLRDAYMLVQAHRHLVKTPYTKPIAKAIKRIDAGWPTLDAIKTERDAAREAARAAKLAKAEADGKPITKKNKDNAGKKRKADKQPKHTKALTEQQKEERNEAKILRIKQEKLQEAQERQRILDQLHALNNNMTD